MESNRIKPLNIKELFTGENKYSIPIYQRNYAWKSKEIEQLIQDVIDYYRYNADKNYYLGTLIIAKRHGDHEVFDTIDGQQRLTTLFILTAALKHELGEYFDWFNSINLVFESREKSERTLRSVYYNEFKDEEFEVNIKAAYDICRREVKKKTIEMGISLRDFSDYLYKKVFILRVPLPEDTDLNHYFEIMNSRGEQLEKHEVLKAKLISVFNKTEHRDVYAYCFNLIWEACQNMERYVQYGFTPEQRHLIFGLNNWNELSINSFDEFVNKIISLDSGKSNPPVDKETALSIDELIKPIEFQETVQKEDSFTPDRFNSVITFPNFLLHVLRIQTDHNDVALDDKKLISAFELCLKGTPKENELFSKTFIYSLLKCRFLYDKYIIKREITANTDRWSLKCLKHYSSNSSKNAVKYVNTFGSEDDESFDNDNRRILMLLAMFHVSIPSQSYKYWLYAALRYVFHHEDINSGAYIKYLEHIAKSFVFERFLSETPKDYQEMIIQDLVPTNRLSEKICSAKLSFHHIENNLVFNFIDYLLWSEKKEKDNKIKSFEYTFRSSVEHYYPQNPIKRDIDLIKDEDVLHSIGNLCLISHEKNSRLNNYSPQAKKEHFSKSDSIDSIKQHLMMDDKRGDWNAATIKNHEIDILNLFEKNINSDFKWEKVEISQARIWFKRYKNENKQLLIRALMCFGQVDFENGWTSGMEKWNFYQWDKIERDEAYKKFEEYVFRNKPTSLDEIIKDNVENNQELKSDSYRYALVSRPYIIDYCQEGNFGWADDGKRFLLMKTSVASKHNACDIYCYCIQHELNFNLGISSYIDYEYLSISLSEQDNKLIPVAFTWNSVYFFNIWNDDNGRICYEVNLENLHGNSKIIRRLKDKGWGYNDNGKLYYESKQFLANLTEDVENNIVKTVNALNSLLKRL